METQDCRRPVCFAIPLAGTLKEPLRFLGFQSPTDRGRRIPFKILPQNPGSSQTQWSIITLNKLNCSLRSQIIYTKAVIRIF